MSVGPVEVALAALIVTSAGNALAFWRHSLAQATRLADLLGRMQTLLEAHDREIISLRSTRHEHANELAKLMVQMEHLERAHEQRRAGLT